MLRAADTYHGPFKKITTHYTAPGDPSDVVPPKLPSLWHNSTVADGQTPSCYSTDDPKAITC